MLTSVKIWELWAFNLLYVNSTEDVSGSENTSMGLDATYAMDNGVELSLGYYTNDNNGTEMDLTTLGASYGVNDDLTVMLVTICMVRMVSTWLLVVLVTSTVQVWNILL